MDDARVAQTVLDISYTTGVTVGKQEITVITEKLPHDKNAPKLVSFSTHGYMKDRVVYKVRKDYTEDIDIMDASQLQRIIEAQHKHAIEEIKGGKAIRREPSEYLKAIRTMIKKRDLKRALAIAAEARDVHPDDPLVLTHYGYLLAMVEKKHKSALEACEKAITLLPRKMPSGLEHSQKPLLYWHLTRVYQSAGNRNGAVQAIYRGIGFDREGGILHKELERIGVRRRPVIPFLGRSSLINRFLGMIRHRLLGPPDQGFLEE